MENLPVIDAHVHLWDTERFAYPWLSNSPLLNQPHGLADYDAAREGQPVERMVFVECGRPVEANLEEAAWVAELAEADPRLAAIVANAPLEQGEAVAGQLERLAAVPGVRGVRRNLQMESPGFCVEPGFVEGVRQLARFELSFDVCVHAGQLEAVIDLAKRCENVRFILDHLGKPNIVDGEFEAWAAAIRRLSELDNVWAKVSGLVTEAEHGSSKAKQLRPYVLHAIECFGCDRLAFGGDWPVVRLAGGWRPWFDAAMQVIGRLSEAERRALLHDTAAGFYGISSP